MTGLESSCTTGGCFTGLFLSGDTVVVENERAQGMDGAEVVRRQQHLLSMEGRTERWSKGKILVRLMDWDIHPAVFCTTIA